MDPPGDGGLRDRLIRWIFGEIRYPTDRSFQRRHNFVAVLCALSLIAEFGLRIARAIVEYERLNAADPLRWAHAATYSVGGITLLMLIRWQFRYGSRFGRPAPPDQEPW
jgi:hypothetical protein